MAIRVLIIEDSAVTRQMLTSILDSDPAIEVVGSASDAIFGLKKVKQLDPDVITCDIEMPRMSGLTFIKELMTQSPKPVVVISAYTARTCQLGLKALELGAVEVIQKIEVEARMQDISLDDYTGAMNEYRDMIVNAVRIAGRARIQLDKTRHQPRSEGELSAHKPCLPASDFAIAPAPVEKKHLIDELIPLKVYKQKGSAEKIIAIGASTGGTTAIGKIMENLPPNLPGIVIIQHIPATFATSFAERLNSISSIEVRQARDGDRLKRGTALIAPGDFHMLIERDHKGYFVKIMDAFPVNRHKPSLDVLFRSVANAAGPNAIGVILTGMNDDGARGMKNMHDNGAHNIAQDKKSCVVFGMPNHAIERGGVDVVAPLHKIPQIIIEKSGTA